MFKIKHLMKDVRHNSLLLITAAVVIILTAAASFIYLFGNSENISIQTSAKTKNQPIQTSESMSGPAHVYVDISGCVKNPGVYELESTSRIFEVIDKAGGFTDKADTSQINQAETITDGMKIHIPERGESGGDTSSSSDSSDNTDSSLVNINSADADTLQQLPGIGPVTAEKIIAYRQENGAFDSVENIMDVDGIGDKTYQKIKEHITV